MFQLNFSSPIGWLSIYADEDSILKLQFANHEPTERDDSGSSPLLIEAQQQLQAYFQGKLTVFNLPLTPEGTSFQEQVWGAVNRIPFGKTTTYGGLATSLGKADAVRAIGRANGQNPIPILVPCHRVIGSGGRLTGYSGGIERKRWLLQHEGALLL